MTSRDVTRFYLVRKSTLYEINRSYFVLHCNEVNFSDLVNEVNSL